MVCNSFSRFDFSLPVGRKTKNQSTSDWFVGQSAISHPLKAGDGIRTRDLLLGKETYYHCTTPAVLGLL